MKAHFEMMARGNAWANRRLYAACAALAEADLRRDLGAAFGSIFGTLSHLLTADVIWLARFRGQAPPGWPLDHLPHDEFRDLAAAREALDADIAAFVAGLDAAALEETIKFRTVVAPAEIAMRLAPALAHFFNHQTHHRGQCHAMLTRLTGAAPSLDLIFMLREEGR